MRKVFCKKFQKELEGLDSPPFPGPLGDLIYNSISKEAWKEWEELQIKIINEYRLNLSNREDYSALKNQMMIFLNLLDGENVAVGDPSKGNTSND